MMRYMRTGLILFAICAVCTALCALVNEVTAPAIALNVEGERVEALDAVAHGLEIGEQEAGDGGNISYVIPLLDNGSVAGYIVEILTSGYGGEMTVIASFDTEGAVLEAQLMANSETPGLGKKAEDPAYMDKVRGLGSDSPLPLSKSDLSTEDAAAVSGASITFGGVSSALHEGSEYVKGLGGAV